MWSASTRVRALLDWQAALQVSFPNISSLPAGHSGHWSSCIVVHFIVIMIFIIRETKFVVSMPIPRNTELCSGPEDCLTIYDSLRRSQKYFNEHKKWQYFVPRSFTNSLRANFIDYDNVIICSNDNLATDNGQVGTMICSKVSHHSHFSRRLQFEIF